MNDQTLSTAESQNRDGMSSLSLPHGFVRDFQGKLRHEEVLSYLTDISIKTSETLDSQNTVPLKAHGAHPVVFFKRDYRAQDKFISLQKWQGIVLKIMTDSFLARLYDQTNRGIEEEVELPLEEISDGDKELLVEGAVFYWNIGYFDSKTGQRKRESITRFRRLPAWRKEELEAAKIEAQQISDLIGWE